MDNEKVEIADSANKSESLGSRVNTVMSLGRSDSERGVKADGWMNLLTGFGTESKDKRMSTKFQGSLRLGEVELRDLYQGDGMVKRIVDLPAKEMMRRGFVVDGDIDGKVQSILEEKHILKKVTEMIRWSRLFGGAIGVLGLEDGGKLNMPVNESAIKRLAFMHVFDRYRVTWTTMDLYGDPNSEKYGQPQFYNVSPVNGLPFVVHESRVVVLDGLALPASLRSMNQNWGDNVIQGSYEKIRALEAVYAGCEAVVEDFIQPVLGIKNLGEMIASGREAEIKTRLDLMDLTRHVLNTLLIDADLETYTKVVSSVAGLSDLIDRFSQALSSTTGIPQTLLMGRSAAGMNATGEGDQRAFYDSISADQVDTLTPVFERICHLIFISQEVGQEPDDWCVEWNPLYEPTEKETAEVRKLRAEASDIYVQMGVIDTDEVRNSPEITGYYELAESPKLNPKVDPYKEPEAEKDTPTGLPEPEGN